MQLLERVDGSLLSTESIRPCGRDVKLAGFTLSVTDGTDKGRTFASRGARVAIGTHEPNDFVLSDPTVSRFHCELTLEGNTVRIRDLESRNRTMVDGVRVRDAELAPHARIVLGRTEIRFGFGTEKVAVRLSERERFGGLVGRSIAARAAFAMLEHAAASDATVLLHGETGTGKEVAAESIHLESARRAGPFIVIDCGGIPPNLLESELFGHERGAFTGAVSAREGAFEAANGGTIFLDEIGELGTDLQPKLLRVLERREVKRVGGNKVMPIDVRVIAATHRDLRGEVNAKRFRSDLYYRLAVLEIRLPPLRDRADDLPLLVEHLFDHLGARPAGKAALLASPGFFEALGHHGWPGNVRELRNYLERCLALEQEVPLEDDGESPPASDGLDLRIDEPLGAARDRVVRAFERAYLAKIVAHHGGNVSAAARAARLDRVHFHRLLRKYGIRSDAL